MEIFRLIDIGNSTATFYENEKIFSQKIDDFSNIFNGKKFYYISVNHNLKKIKNGINLKKFTYIDTKYNGLGIDRKIAIKAIKNGIIVDAGSAITVDIVQNSQHKGGFILSGIHSTIQSFENISPALKMDFKKSIDLHNIPQNTNQALNYALLKSIILPIKEIQNNQKIYFTGGDGKFLSKYFDNCKYDKKLIFKGMINVIRMIK